SSASSAATGTTAAHAQAPPRRNPPRLITAPWPREHPPDLTTSGASLLRFARRRPAGSRAHGVFRLLPGLRGIRAGRTGAASETRRAGGFRTAVDFRSLPPVEFRTGQQPVRLVGDRRLVTSDGS